ncbi:hypothetical protein [uncultured Draconibacterium sp.]|uniref:hypothetical protein n=1 Tax=uncultured Draconibacterium sp. TaxID=1573823 RepID=UPI0032177EF8
MRSCLGGKNIGCKINPESRTGIGCHSALPLILISRSVKNHPEKQNPARKCDCTRYSSISVRDFAFLSSTIAFSAGTVAFLSGTIPFPDGLVAFPGRMFYFRLVNCTSACLLAIKFPVQQQSDSSPECSGSE